MRSVARPAGAKPSDTIRSTLSVGTVANIADARYAPQASMSAQMFFAHANA